MNNSTNESCFRKWTHFQVRMSESIALDNLLLWTMPEVVNQITQDTTNTLKPNIK